MKTQHLTFMKHFYLFFALSLFLSCQSNKKQQVNIVEEPEALPVINLSQDIERCEYFPISEAAEKIDIVSLDNSDEALFDEIKQIEVTETDIWIAPFRSQQIFRFDRNGKFLNKVGKVGQGPEEYTLCAHFVVNHNKKKIYIMSVSSGILAYDFEGNFIEKLSNSTMGSMYNCGNGYKFIQYADNFFLLQNLPALKPVISNPVDSLWSIALVDNSFKKTKIYKNPAHIGREVQIVENGGENTGWKNQWGETYTVTDFYNDELTLKYSDTDTIYRYDIATKAFQPQYAIHSNEDKGSYEETHQVFKTRSALNYFTIRNYWPSKNIIYLRTTKGETVSTFAYEKNTGKIKVAEQNIEIIERKTPYYTTYTYANGIDNLPFSFKNDFQAGTFQIQYTSSGKYWIDIFEPGSERTENMIQELEKSNDTKASELLKQLKGMNEDSSPILLIATLK